MDTTVSIALSHQVAKRRQMDIIANNIANMGTTAFKRESVIFRQYLAEAKGDMPKALRQISYVQDYGVGRNMSDGQYETTGNIFDIALNGKGLFQVKRGNGEMAYTRNGHLTLSDQYVLITSTGQEIMDTGGKPIQIPKDVTNLKVASDGTISSPQIGIIAKLNVVDIGDTSKLKKIGNNMFSLEAPPAPATDFKIMQGMTETSNVQPIVEITRMIDVSRSYIRTAKILENLQNTQSKALNQLAKVG